MPRAPLALAAALAALALACGTDQPSTLGDTAHVERVVDGDTIRVRFEGASDIERVRLILIDAPEVTGAGECFGDRATTFVTGLLPAGTIVRLERDVSETDRFDRLLRYVYLEDGRMLNELLVAEGYASVATFPPDLRHLDRMRAAEAAARAAGRGLWSAC